MTVPTDLHGDPWDAAAQHHATRVVLPVAGAIAALLAILSAPWALDRAWLNLVFKPLATLCVIAWATLRPTDDPAVKRWIVIGLWASLAGDVALLWPAQGFLPGLVSFLVAHAAYLVAFTRVERLTAVPLVFVIYGAVAAVILSQLWHGVPADLRAPVIVYVAALAAMAAQGLAVAWRRRGTPQAVRWWHAAIGGAVFMASDATLATDRFVGGVPMPGLFILATYWIAQWFIASAAAPVGADAFAAEKRAAAAA